MTGDQSMKWVGKESLPTTSSRVAIYDAVPALPDLTAPKAMRAFGESDPVTSTKESVEGSGWSTSVSQTPYATRVQFQRQCGTLSEDPDTAIKEGTRVLTRLGAAPKDWAWFTITDGSGTARAIAEPTIDGRQTWATGSFAVLVDEQGVCAANGVLMAFKDSGGTARLASAYDTFQEARHTDGLAIKGDYDEYQQTWTLASEGEVVPLWEYDADTHGIVAVDLGTGLETALNTQSMLEAQVSDEKKQ